MRDFFKGWKRKTGAVTLAVACVFMVGWVRSEFVQDFLKIRHGNDATELGSTNGRLYWFCAWDTEDNPFQRDFNFAWDNDGPIAADHKTILQFAVFDFQDRILSHGRLRIRYLSTPYWSIVLPLTLLSAWLLLSKRPLLKRSEAAQVEGIA